MTAGRARKKTAKVPSSVKAGGWDLAHVGHDRPRQPRADWPALLEGLKAGPGAEESERLGEVAARPGFRPTLQGLLPLLRNTREGSSGT